MLLINDLKRHTESLRPVIDDAIRRVVDRGWYVAGPELEEFEKEFARFCGVAECAGVGNGTDALELALRAAGVGRGSRVATVANAGMYSTAAILACGAQPVWVDVAPRNYNMDPERLADAVRTGVDAVVVTHLYGVMAPMPELLQAARGVPVIEDCAQAHGARLDGRPAGAWGAAGCFSFYPTKNLGALGDGGAVVTGDPEVARKLRSLRQYGWSAKYVADVPGGRNSRLDELQAAVLRAKLPYLDGWNRRRREIAAAYGFAKRPLDESDVAHLYVVRHACRDMLRQRLREQGIGAEVHYPVPDYRQEAVRASLGETDPLPVTEHCCREVLTLPCFPEMTGAEVERVAEVVRREG